MPHNPTPAKPPAYSEPATLRLAGVILALGSLAVVVTCVFYRLSPAAIALPVTVLDVAAALQGGMSGAHLMRLAGQAGIGGDLAITASALVIAHDRMLRGRPMAAIGWILIGLDTIVFLLTDSLVAYVLPPVAATGSAPTLVGFKALFDVSFLVGAATLGLGSLMAMGSELSSAMPQLSRWAAAAGLLAGLISTMVAVGSLSGAPLHTLAGPSIAVSVIIYTWIGLEIALRPDRAALSIRR